MPVRLRTVDVAVTQYFASGVAHAADGDVEVERDASQRVIAINGDGFSLDPNDGDDLQSAVVQDCGIASRPPVDPLPPLIARVSHSLHDPGIPLPGQGRRHLVLTPGPRARPLNPGGRRLFECRSTPSC
jgi:hypothetical protein